MNKEAVFEVFMQADAGDVNPLAEQLRTRVNHTVIQEPSQELIMFQMEESVEKIDFNVGEILVTTAHIRVDGAVGFSMVLDMDESKALDCALLMAIYEAGLPEAVEVESLAISMADKQQQQLRHEREIISSTRVNFEVMGGQDANVKHNNGLE